MVAHAGSSATTATSHAATTALAATGWLLTAATVTAIFVMDAQLRDAGRTDLATISTNSGVIYIPVMFSAATVGVVVASRRPRHPVGWLFLALGLFVAVSGAMDDYASYGLLARPGSRPAAAFVANASGAIFMPWLVIIALVLYLTPTGRALSARWGRVAGVTAVAGVTGFVVALFSRSDLDPPFQAVRNNLVLPGSDAFGPIIRGVSVPVLMLGLIASAVCMIIRFRGATGTERQQLHWLALVAVPLPAFVVLAFATSLTHHPLGVNLATAGFVLLVPVAAGLAVMQYHLYDVDRILSRAATYLVLSGLIAGAYAAVVILVGRWLGDVAQRSSIAAVLGTLAAVSVALPARRVVQEAVDRRFNRRRFDAVQVVRRYLRDPVPGRSIDDVLRQAVAQPGLCVAYWVEDRHQWVTVDGQSVEPAADSIEVRRAGRPVARVTAPPEADGHLVTVAAREALPELDNARLRAAITLQLVEVQESRSRIAAAQLEERRRLERNLHDGAQQRLLATALNLKAAQMNGEPARLRDAMTAGIDEIQVAVADLRALAHGLHPAVLDDGGLVAALEDLAARTPGSIHLRAADGRFPADVEVTAWYIACEAIANAAKHAGAPSIAVTVDRDGTGALLLQVDDDGIGGADPDGRGLRGIADRAETAGGTLTVGARPGGGTTVAARLPCRS
jgi:signal transduction histidine kinase